MLLMLLMLLFYFIYFLFVYFLLEIRCLINDAQHTHIYFICIGITYCKVVIIVGQCFNELCKKKKLKKIKERETLYAAATHS